MPFSTAALIYAPVGNFQPLTAKPIFAQSHSRNRWEGVPVPNRKLARADALPLNQEIYPRNSRFLLPLLFWRRGLGRGGPLMQRPLIQWWWRADLGQTAPCLRHLLFRPGAENNSTR